MHLGVEAVAMAGDLRGIGRYTRRLLSHFARLRPGLRVTLYTDSTGKASALAAELPGLGYGPERGAVARTGSLRADPPDLAWYPWNKTKHFSSARRMVVTIHDLVPFHFRHRGWHRQRLQRKVERRFRETASRADLILTDSEYSRNDIVAHLGVPREKVTVIPLAADDFVPATGEPDRAGLAERFGIVGRFLLYVGANEERKNLGRLREAFQALRSRELGAVQLVICGAKRDGGAAEPGTLWPGRVSEEELRMLYHGAMAFVQPSLLEGFGLPVLEAMASGTPVLCSGTTSLTEVAGNAALYFDPLDVSTLATQMERCLTDDRLRAGLSARGLQRARVFSWEETARRTLAAFDEVIAGAVQP